MIALGRPLSEPGPETRTTAIPCRSLRAAALGVLGFLVSVFPVVFPAQLCPSSKPNGEILPASLRQDSAVTRLLCLPRRAKHPLLRDFFFVNTPSIYTFCFASKAFNGTLVLSCF